MRKVVSTIALASICVLAAFAEKERGKGNDEDLVVENFPAPIPNNIPQANKLIWNFISKRPEQQWFIHYSTKDWRKNYDLFARAIVAKAKKREMDYETLEKLLKELPADEFIRQPQMPERACLPIGAYPVVIGERKLWVIFCLWEYAVDPEKIVEDGPRIPGQVSDTKAKPTKRDWDDVSHVLAIVYYAEGDVFTFVSCD